MSTAEEAVSRARRILSEDKNLGEEILRRAASGELRLPGVTFSAIERAFDPTTRSRGGFESMAAAAPGVERADISAGAFEAIVRLVGRPPLLIKNGTYVKPANVDLQRKLDPNRKAINKVIASVGRVEFRLHRMPWAGTGWMIDKNIAVTNRHVAEFVVESDSRGGYRFKTSPTGRPYGAKLDYLEEYEGSSNSEANLVRVKFLSANESLDIALFEVEADSPLPAPIPLSDAKKIVTGLQIGVVGYPADDPDRNDPDRIRDYFGNIFDVKRLSAGEISSPPDDGVLMHDATTLGGNSGSVVFDLASGSAVGLHFAGTYTKGNYALDANSIKKVLRGLKTVVAGIEMPQLEKKDSTHSPDFFKGRDGYVPDFLGKAYKVPLLGVKAFGPDVAQATEADGSKTKVLNYRHFSVQYSTSRKLPIYTASNIDGGQSRKVKRGDDQWFQDLRLPREIQLGEKDYGRDVIDRGHMVKREDPVWGSEEEALQANFDTFHYTNSAPQHRDLNQRSEAWRGLEDFILGSARTEGLKISVFTGPVLRKDDKTDPDFPSLGKIPREFFKVVVAVDSDSKKLYASGYVLSQGTMIQDFTEAIVFGDWNTYQVPIAQIAKATGLDFGVLASVDTMAGTGTKPKKAKKTPKKRQESVGIIEGPRPILLSSATEAYLGEPAAKKAKGARA